MKKVSLSSYSLEELEKMRQLIEPYEDLSVLKKDIQTMIAKKEVSKETINERFDIALIRRLEIFDAFQLAVLESNHITNMQELIDSDLDSFVGITPSMKRMFEWARQFYDLRGMVSEKPVQKSKKRK